VLNFFIDRPVFSTVISLVILLAGALAGLNLPIAQYPQVVPPQVQVSTSFPGANAQVVAESVAAPIEQQVNGAKDMIYMGSKSGADGSYNLVVSFEVGTNADIAAVDVQNRFGIAQSQLPADVARQGVTIRKVSTDFLEVFALTSPDGRYDNVFLSNYATLNMVDALTRVHGVGQVRVFGARDYAMRIWLDPDRMARLGVTAGDVADAIREQNVVVPGGVIGAPPAPAGTQMQYTVNVLGRLSEVPQYEAMVVRAAADGQVVRLRDIARIELSGADFTITARERQLPSAFIAIFLSPDANALDVDRGVRVVMNEFARAFPEGMVYSVPYSTVPFVRQSLKEVGITLGIAFVLVAFVVFLFLQSWRATLIPIVAVPVSLVGTLAAFEALGFSINTLTLFGLVLAIGIVVDDAIVVVEAVQHRIDSQGQSPLDATKGAVADVGGPVIAIALVLSAVFVPVAFLGGLTGQLYRQFALTLAVSVILSALVALTLTPALCALLLRPARSMRRGPLAPFYRLFNRGFEGFRSRYLRSIDVLVHHAALVLGTFGVLLVALYFLVHARPTSLVPDEDQGYLIGMIQLPLGSSLQRSGEVYRQVETMSHEVGGIEGLAALEGFNLFTGIASPYNVTTFIRLKPWSERDGKPGQTAGEIAREMNQRINGRIKEAQAFVVNPPPIRGMGGPGGFEFVLQDRAGGTLPRFTETLQDFQGRARKRPELGLVFANFDPRVPQIEYSIDRDKVKSLGVKLADVNFALQAFLGSYYVNDFNLYGRTFHVQMQAEPSARAQPEDVGRLYVRSDGGAMVPLSTVVTIRPVNGPQYYERYNIYRAATINFSPAPGYSSGQAAAAMEEVAGALPPGYGFEWTGSEYQEKKTGGKTSFVFALSLAFVFLVLAALYESWSIPVSILLVIPFGVFGAFVGIALRGMANDVYTQIGLIMLIGLAAKNAILIVEFAKIERERGAPIMQAATRGAALRLRPILMTSFAFVFGSLPLAIATGAGSGARQAIGTAVVSGMLFATMIGIFLIPVFYVVMQRISEGRWPFRPEDAGQRPAPESAGLSGAGHA